MIIEFIGSTGAGKTTLIRQICTACECQANKAVIGYDFVLKQWGLDQVSSTLLRMGLMNLIALLVALWNWRKHLVFYRFASGVIWRLPRTIGPLERLYLARNILKKVGIYEVIRRHGAENQIYLVDEGTVHVAHNLFVQVGAAADRSDLATFASLVPLPDVVVYVQHNQAVMVERTLARGHHRIQQPTLSEVVVFIKQAVTVFDELVQNPTIERRLLIADSAQQRVKVPGLNGDPLPLSIAKLVQSGIEACAKQNQTAVSQLA